MYDTLGHEAFDYILKITEGTLIIAEQKMINNLIKVLSHNKYNIREVCLFDTISNEEKDSLRALGV